jgi:Ca2+-binding RTX toxin-like protein
MKKSVVISGVTALMVALLGAVVHAAFIEGDDNANVLIGKDDDNTANTTIQPPGTVANQSLNNTDVIDGKGGPDILIGLLGNDVLRGGQGDDILIGGTEQFTTPNSDIIYGEDGNDVNIWAPGDGSDAFIGGRGISDAQVFGVIDRVNGVPTLTPVSSGRHKKTGVPTAEVTLSPGFCTLESVDPAEFGFSFLVRFFVRATGNLAVTIRVTDDVEQVFCTSQAGGAITFADLTADDPQFVEVSLAEVEQLNSIVEQIIR